jgi:hypothetical protein
MKYYLEYQRKLYDLIINDNNDTVKAFDLPKNIQPSYASKGCKESKYFNSDLWKNILSRAHSNVVGKWEEFLRLDKLPDCVEVDSSGYLAIVRVDISKHIKL